MHVFTGHHKLNCPADRGELLFLKSRLELSGHLISRIELSQEEATLLMTQLFPREFNQWVAFSTIVGIPFAIVKDEALVYSI